MCVGSRVRVALPDEQKLRNRETILRGLFERAALAREFRSSLAILELRVRVIGKRHAFGDRKPLGYALLRQRVRRRSTMSKAS